MLAVSLLERIVRAVNEFAEPPAPVTEFPRTRITPHELFNALTGRIATRQQTPDAVPLSCDIAYQAVVGGDQYTQPAEIEASWPAGGQGRFHLVFQTLVDGSNWRTRSRVDGVLQGDVVYARVQDSRTPQGRVMTEADLQQFNQCRHEMNIRPEKISKFDRAGLN